MKSRDELLEFLHSISFCTFLTVLPTEECLEVEIMSSNGTSYSWIGYDDWRVYHVSSEESAKLVGVCDLNKNGDISKQALKGTYLYSLADTDEPNEVVKQYLDYSNKGNAPGEEFYCYFDEGERKYYFFSNEAEIAEALNKYYSCVDAVWEDMDTEELSLWIDRYESADSKIPFRYIGD